MSPTQTPKTVQQKLIDITIGSLAALLVLAPLTAHSATRAAGNSTGDPAATAAVAALVGPDPADALTTLPAQFTATMGYRPIVEPMADGRYPANPAGSCSSPVPLPARFEPLCRTHDLGYDLLRYAQRRGRPLGGWARTALDTMLINRMIASCTDPTCTASARAAQAALALNTWRQYDGPPSSGETTLDVVIGVGRRGVESVVR